MALDQSVTGAMLVRPWSFSHAPDGAVLGTASGTIEGEAQPLTLVVSAYEVMPEARGQGVGKALLAEIDAVAIEAQAASIMIVTDCPIERMFFIRYGYSAREGGVGGLQTGKHYAVVRAVPS